MSNSAIVVFKALSLTVLIAGVTAYGSTSTSKGASTGAVVGGLVDGWSGAAVGALIGGGVGYAVDRAEDKKRQQEIREREVAALENSSISSNPATAYRPANSNNLTGSTWRVISLVDEEKKTPEFKSMVLSFQTNTKATTLVIWADDRTETFVESYTVLDDALVLTGLDYVTNAKYSINGKQMILVSPSMRVVLEEVEERT